MISPTQTQITISWLTRRLVGDIARVRGVGHRISGLGGGDEPLGFDVIKGVTLEYHASITSDSQLVNSHYMEI